LNPDELARLLAASSLLPEVPWWQVCSRLWCLEAFLEVVGSLHSDALNLLKQMQGSLNQAIIA
jgi:hypothetical protein